MYTLEQTHVLAPGAVKGFITAGRALFTVLNTETGNRFTFRVNKGRQETAPHFVSVLTGSENTTDYSYIGVIFDGARFRWTSKSRINRDAPSVKAFAWLWRNVDRLPEFVEVRHHNRCGRCNRVLTVPESIDTGLGPICAGR